jgi:hypothetical protein
MSDTIEEVNFKNLLFKLKEDLLLLKNNWLKIFIIGIIGGIIGFFVAFFKPVSYTGKLTFVLEEGKSSGGGLAAIAGQFGLDVNSASSSNSNMLAGDNIIGLLKSRRFTEAALLSAIDSSSKLSLADKYADIYELRDRWKNNSKINREIFFPVQASRQGYNRLQDSLIQVIEEAIFKECISVERADKKMSFFEVTVSFKDELLAKLYTERIVKNAIDFYIETKTRRLRNNVERLQKRADSIGALLNGQTYTAAAIQSSSLDINPAYQTAGVNAEVNVRNKMMLGTIYGEVVKNLEIQKATLTQETPIIQIVDSIELPLKKNKPSKLIHIIIGCSIASLLFIIYIVLFKKKANNSIV